MVAHDSVFSRLAIPVFYTAPTILRCCFKTTLSPLRVVPHCVVAYARLAFWGKPTIRGARTSIDSLDSSLLGKKVSGSGIITALPTSPTKENPTSAMVTGKALRFVTSMQAKPSGIKSLSLDKNPPPLLEESLGTTFNRTRRCQKPCTKFQTPSTAPIAAVTAVKLISMISLLEPLSHVVFAADKIRL